MFLTVFRLYMPKRNRSFSLFFKERLERFALIALYKRATVSKSLPSLFTKKQPCASHSFFPSKSLCALLLKKRAIHSKKQRTNSQLCFLHTNCNRVVISQVLTWQAPLHSPPSPRDSRNRAQISERIIFSLTTFT